MARERESEGPSTLPKGDSERASMEVSARGGDDPVVDLSDAAATEGNRLTAFDLRLTQVDRRLSDLADESNRRRHEIDVLQEALSEETGPLRKRPTFLAEALSAVAALAAVVVAVLALEIQQGALEYQREVDARQQARELQADRADLRGILQVLTEIVREEAVIRQQEAADQGEEAVVPGEPAVVAGEQAVNDQTRTAVLGELNSKRRVLVGQAVALVRRLGKTEQQVSSAEYTTLGQSLLQLGEHAEARTYFVRAAKATRYVDKLHAVRSTAYIDLTTGHEDKGRQGFEEALRLRHEHADLVLPANLRASDIETRHMWAATELQLGHCQHARTVLDQALEVWPIINELPDFRKTQDQLSVERNRCDDRASSVSGG